MGSYLGIPRRRKKVFCKLRCLMPVTVFTNSAGFLIRCMRLFDAIREELVPYGTQTFPSVASASLHLINGICASIRSILLSGISQLKTYVWNFFSSWKVGYITPIHPALDHRLRRHMILLWGLQCRAQRSPKFIPLVTYLLLQYNCKKCYTLCPTADKNRKNKELFYKPIYVGLRSTTLRSSGYGLLEGFRRST